MSDTQEQESLRLALLQQGQTLVQTALGLVAALAWNAAIQDLFTRLFPARSSLIAEFAYAIFITILVVVLSRRLSVAIASLRSFHS